MHHTYAYDTKPKNEILGRYKRFQMKNTKLKDIKIILNKYLTPSSSHDLIIFNSCHQFTPKAPTPDSRGSLFGMSPSSHI